MKISETASFWTRFSAALSLTKGQRSELIDRQLSEMRTELTDVKEEANKLRTGGLQK